VGLWIKRRTLSVIFVNKMTALPKGEASNYFAKFIEGTFPKKDTKKQPDFSDCFIFFSKR